MCNQPHSRKRIRSLSEFVAPVDGGGKVTPTGRQVGANGTLQRNQNNQQSTQPQIAFAATGRKTKSSGLSVIHSEADTSGTESLARNVRRILRLSLKYMKRLNWGLSSGEILFDELGPEMESMRERLADPRSIRGRSNATNGVALPQNVWQL